MCGDYRGPSPKARNLIAEGNHMSVSLETSEVEEKQNKTLDRSEATHELGRLLPARAAAHGD